MTVLFVDDEQNWLDLIRITAEAAAPDVMVLTARTVAEGAAAARAAHPDVAVVDLRMPVLAGDALLYMIRREMPHVRLLVCSAYLTPEVEALLTDIGIPTCPKPVDLPRLLSWVRDPKIPCAA